MKPNFRILLGPYYVSGLLWEVRTRFPKLEPRFQEGQTAALVQSLLAGELDVVLLALACCSWRKVIASAIRLCRCAANHRGKGSPA